MFVRNRKNQGVITVFVTLIMVPVVAFTGIMVDAARLKSYSSQAAMVADSYGEAVLGEYDNLLKELYGLFSVTQSEEGMEALEELKKYSGYAFVPNGDENGLDGFMPYKNAIIEIDYENVDGATLDDNNVLMTQISDFMRFRIVEQVLNENGILDAIEQVENLDADMDAVEARSEITDSCAEALEKVDDYYRSFKKISNYPAFIETRENAYVAYVNKIKEIKSSEGYAKYVAYLADKTNIDNAVAKKQRIDDATSRGETTEEVWTEADQTLYDKYVDSSYVSGITTELNDASDKAKIINNGKIGFDNVGTEIAKLNTLAGQIEPIFNELANQVATLESKLNECSEDVAQRMRDEMKDVEKLSEMRGKFRQTYNLIETTNTDTAKNTANKELLDTQVQELDAIKDSLISGTLATSASLDCEETIEFEWYDFNDDNEAKDFFDELKAMCEAQNEGAGDKSLAEERTENADNKRAEAEAELEGDEESEARDIPEAFVSEFNASTGGNIPSVSERLAGGLSFDEVGSIGNGIIGKFLLSSYDFGMFSSRVTGIEPELEDGGDAGDLPVADGDEGEEGEYYDESLTGIKLSPDVNYLYGAELEYLFGGHAESDKNLTETRNIICGVRLTMNFLSTYRIGNVNTTIEDIANAAATAAAAVPGVGTAASFLIRVAVSGAIRMAIATMETVADWNDLKARKEVIFFKIEVQDLSIVNELSDVIGGSVDTSGTKSDGFKMSYEDYMYVLLTLFVNQNDLLDRTSNLITLNVNQSQNDGGTLSALDFKMSDTVTAIKSSCNVNLKFVIVPDNFLNMFITADSADIMQKVDNSAYKYSIIRGY